MTPHAPCRWDLPMSDLDDRLADYLAAAELATVFGGAVLDADDIGIRAMAYAVAGWPVFPLQPRSKQPAIAGGQGFKDASTDPLRVCTWWAMEYPGANIGWVPDWDKVIVLDLDRHSAGQDGIARFKELTGSVHPETMVVQSGGGGMHVFYNRPEGRISGEGLKKKFGLAHGIDLKVSGYLVAPGSVHPDTGRQYTGIISPLADLPYSIARMIVVPERVIVPRTTGATYEGNSIADWFTATATWAAILLPHGWTCITADTEGHGALWRHPAATAPQSAMIDRYGQLHVFSWNTEFESSQGAGSGMGYTKFKAFAVLNHGGDMTKAAIHLQELKWELGQ